MLQNLGTFDVVVLVVLLVGLTFSSFLAGLFKKKSGSGASEDYFMAGRSLRWWSVAGSIYGTNVSAVQIIGMLGVGYSIGFAQSHYEILAILPILALAYIFIPIYRKREVFTLSQFLANRYDGAAQTAYSLLNISFIVIQTVAGFYIASRTLGLLFNGSGFEITYLQGIIAIAVVAGVFAIFGGMESVVIADNIQTVLMVFSAITVGLLTFAQPEIKGFWGLLHLDQSVPLAQQKMHLYLPSNHKDLPWTGAFTGLMILHFFYWTTNQYQVQRVLAAASDRDAKLGTIAAGFLKLTIPFFSIAAGVAAAYIFKIRLGITDIKPDDAFLKLTEMVLPSGYGIKGLILAGLTSALLSSIYSMLNSFTTLISVDIYKKLINPQANNQQVVRFGKMAIAVVVTLAAFLALYSYDPSSAGNFSLTVSAQLSYLKPGIVVAFFIGIFWRKVHPKTAMITMLAAPVFAIIIEQFYNHFLGTHQGISDVFGVKLNFMHRVFLTTIFCACLQIFLSKRWTKTDTKFNGTDLTIAAESTILKWFGYFLAMQSVFVIAFKMGADKTIISLMAALATGIFLNYSMKTDVPITWKDDRFYAKVLATITIWILYYFA